MRSFDSLLGRSREPDFDDDRNPAMTSAEYHDLAFGIRCALCSRPLLPTVFAGWDLAPREWQPCSCSDSLAVGPIAMRYEGGELRLARMKPARPEHPLVAQLRAASYLDVGMEPPR